MIERYLVQYFLAVVDQGNFSRAAQQCRVSQPTLSVGIAKLEALTGQVLFHRSNRRVELTGAGAAFAAHARRIEAEFAAALATLSGGGREGMLLRIGLVSSLPPGPVEAAACAAAQVPDERVEFAEGRMRDLLPRLARGRLDAVIGLAEAAGGRDARVERVLFEEGYALAMAPDHPLAAAGSVSPAEVAGEAMIVRRGCEALSAVSRFFTRHGVRPFMAARTTGEDRAIAFVRAGLGVTVMPECFAGEGLATARLEGFELRRSVALIVPGEGAGRAGTSAALAALCASLRPAS